MNLAPEVVKVILVTGIPLMVISLCPFWGLRRLRVFYATFTILFFLQFILIGMAIGLAGSTAGFGSGGSSPWDGPSAHGTLSAFGAIVFVVGRTLRKVADWMRENSW